MPTETNFPNQQYTSIETKELDRLRACEDVLMSLAGRIVQLTLKYRKNPEIIGVLEELVANEITKPMEDYKAKWGVK